MLGAIATSRTALVVALADHQSDWTAIVEMIEPVGLDVGQVKNSDTGQTAWSSVIRLADARGDDVLRQLLSQLEQLIHGDEAVLAAIRAFRRARTLTGVLGDCELLRAFLNPLLRRGPEHEEVAQIESALVRLATVARHARERHLAAAPAHADEPDLTDRDGRSLAELVGEALAALERFREARRLEITAPRARRAHLTAERVAATLAVKDAVIDRRQDLVEALENVVALRLGVVDSGT
jgi:hypothetical protein